MLEEDADIKRLFIRKTGAGPQVEIAGVGKVWVVRMYGGVEVNLLQKIGFHWIEKQF